MILADKIIDLRKKNGWSQEELAELLDVSRQSISKWEGAQAMPDMNKILKMAKIFGVSTDYLLKDELSAPEYVESPDDAGELRHVSMEEASEFLELKRTNSGRVALGVMMCIFSPVLLIVLSAAQEFESIKIAETAATGIGLIVLLSLVAGAVAIFIRSVHRIEKFEYMESEAIDTEYGVKGMVSEKKEQFRPTFNLWITIGVVLCVISAIPLFITLVIFGENDFVTSISIALILCLVAIGVYMIVRVSTVQGSFQMLLEEGDYTREEKAHNKRTGWIAGVYWSAVVIIFLVYGFVTADWGRTWILWAVAGIGFGILATIIRSIGRK